MQSITRSVICSGYRCGVTLPDLGRTKAFWYAAPAQLRDDSRWQFENGMPRRSRRSPRHA